MTDRSVGRWPLILSALVVFAAVAVMVRLGFWQLDRLAQKQAMQADYAEAAKAPEQSFEGWGQGNAAGYDWAAYRRVRFDCQRVSGIAARAGQNASGQSGWRHLARCTAKDGTSVGVVLGWSLRPDVRIQWDGGWLRGTLNSDRLIIADPPLAGLQPNARPDPAAISNNHLAYAVQWFAFALIALVIYALALRKRIWP